MEEICDYDNLATFDTAQDADRHYGAHHCGEMTIFKVSFVVEQVAVERTHFTEATTSGEAKTK